MTTMNQWGVVLVSSCRRSNVNVLLFLLFFSRSITEAAAFIIPQQRLAVDSRQRCDRNRNRGRKRTTRITNENREDETNDGGLPNTSLRASGDCNEEDEPKSKLTDWVIENLEEGETSDDDDDSASSSSTSARITCISQTKAGENDTLPEGGLRIGRFRIAPAGMSTYSQDEQESDADGNVVIPIRLLLGRNGWGTGVHPTTRLCLEWLSRRDVMSDFGGETVLDYGCGSGILSIGALGLGAARAVGVDVEAEALVASERNLELNGFADRFEGLHTREVIPYSLFRPTGADICVANILIGQLVRPSMVSAIITNLAPGALLCFSGIRPNEVQSLKVAYGDYVDWLDDHYAELSATETEGSIDSYGFDVGTWSRLVGRVKADGGIGIEAMSELAVS